MVEQTDARPFLQSSAQSLWAGAERRADELVALLRRDLAERGINAAVSRSPNGTHPTVVRMDAWIPAGVRGGGRGSRTVRRVSLTLTCRVLPPEGAPQT